MSSSLGAEPHIVCQANEHRLDTPPADCISDVRFSPDARQPRQLLASSWDCGVYVYDAGTAGKNHIQCKYYHDSPVLCATWIDGGCVSSGGVDGTVKTFDIQSGVDQPLGAHEKAVRCIEYSQQANALVTGSWDGHCALWDRRSPSSLCIGRYRQAERVYAMAICDQYQLIVGTAGRKVWIWDLRRMAAPAQRRESALKYQTRCIRPFATGSGYVLSSIEGRVSVEYMSPDSETQKQKYAFKCHRAKEDGKEVIYPVNAIAFHPLHSTFATGGSDALVNIWDPFNKKRLCQLHKYATSVSSLAFNADGSLLAIATSYLHETPLAAHNGAAQTQPQDNICIRRVADQETRPKS